MSKARSSLLRSSLVHLALISYTVIALFPVFLTLVNSLKARKAIFREPLAFPTPETFSLVGYETVLKQSDFLGYRSEEHTSKLQSLMRISYAVFCLKKKT